MVVVVVTQSGRHWSGGLSLVTCDLPVDAVGPVARAHGGVAGGVLAGDVGALRVGVEDEQRLVVAADALRRHVLPLGPDLQHNISVSTTLLQPRQPRKGSMFKIPVL